MEPNKDLYNIFNDTNEENKAKKIWANIGIGVLSVALALLTIIVINFRV